MANQDFFLRPVQYWLLWCGTVHHIFPALNLNASIYSLDCEQSLFCSKIRGKNLTPAYHVRKWACYVIDANCQRASEMQYESRAVSLFALRSLSRPRYSRLAASPLAARISPS